MSSVCPVCGAEQSQSLACHSCTTRLERELGDVASIVADLDVALSKQARIGNGGTAGLARERTPISIGAMEAGDNLANVLTTWARDVSGIQRFRWTTNPTSTAVSSLLANIDAIRRHPEVAKLTEAITDAISKARRVVDRPADRVYLGQCMVPTQDDEGQDVTCWEDIYASPSASEVRCKVCGVTHPVRERRAWLLTKAEDMIVSIKEASSYLGEVGGITVTQASIRGYVHRQKLAYRAPVDAKRFRLGDLLAVLVDESERKSA